MNKTFVLCDGKVESCRKTGCYKNGGECRHTTDIKHAINPTEKREFVKTGLEHDNWEIEHN